MKTIAILFILSLTFGGLITTSVFATNDIQQTNPELELIQALGCKGCHTFAGNGGSLAVNLDNIGARLTVAKIEKQLIHGSASNAEKFMPSYRTLPANDIKNLSSFLYNH